MLGVSVAHLFLDSVRTSGVSEVLGCFGFVREMGWRGRRRVSGWGVDEAQGLWDKGRTRVGCRHRQVRLCLMECIAREREEGWRGTYN